MSYLAKLKQIENEKNFKNIPDSALPKLPKPPFGSFGSTNLSINKKNISEIAVITPEQLEKIRTWLNHAGEPEEDHYLVLNKCRRDSEALTYCLAQVMQYEREKRRMKVLSMLESNPHKQRAYVTDTESDTDNVILTVAIRGVGTFEMLILKINYSPFLLMEMIDKQTQ